MAVAMADMYANEQATKQAELLRKKEIADKKLAAKKVKKEEKA